MATWRERMASWFAPRRVSETEVVADPASGVKVVTTALPLKPAARARLSEQLGHGFIVVDMKNSPGTADVVIAPVVSTQLIGTLRDKFPKARLVLCELQDFDLGINQTGPVQRALDAGADSYCIAPSLADLADFVSDDQPALQRRTRALSFRRPTTDDLVRKELQAITPRKR